jgi:hypothetical protein
MLSCQAVLGCFFLSILQIKQTKHSSAGTAVSAELRKDVLGV